MQIPNDLALRELVVSCNAIGFVKMKRYVKKIKNDKLDDYNVR